MNCSILEFQVSVKGSRGSLAIGLLLLAALAALAYGPTLSIPLIEDDYPNLWEAHTYGPAAALPVLFHNSVFRLRATTYWTMWPLWRLSQTTAWPYHVFSLLLHVANVWLAWAVAWLWPRMRPAAFWTAAFFAVAEGHQEAVMWFSAISELYMFLFGAASLVCWLLARRPGRRRFWEAASVVLFGMALLSKESAVIWLPLFWLIGQDQEGRPGGPPHWVRLLPHAALACLAVASVAASRGSSFRFSDGSFSLHAPFWFTWPYGIARVLWIWGWIALAAIACSRTPSLRKPAWMALAWIGIALVPYSFLTYSRQIPSRQTYLASFGLALLVGLAMAHLAASRWEAGKWLRAATVVEIVAAAVLLGNVEYLWSRKRAQFLARAEPTEQLIRLARQTEGPIWVRCFPRVPYIAQEAVHMAAGRAPSTLLWSQAETERRKPAAVFCYRER
jgi:hypothetical protein